jgi:hypothetical protein
MPRPTTQYEWATEDVEEVVNVGGSNIIFPNKTEPTDSYLNTGVEARQPWPQAYINYILNSHYQWIQWLLEGEIGDVRFMPTSTTATDMDNTFNGTWEDLGTTTLTTSISGSETFRLFRKTA